MDQAITLGMVLWVLGAVVGFAVVLALFIGFLSFLASQFKN